MGIYDINLLMTHPGFPSSVMRLMPTVSSLCRERGGERKAGNGGRRREETKCVRLNKGQEKKCRPRGTEGHS